MFAYAAVAFFYRRSSHPLRPVKSDEKTVHVWAPTHGTVMCINSIPGETARWHVAFFLSPLDEHYQYHPVGGKVQSVEYDATGRFELAFDLNKSVKNEKAIHTVRNDRGVFVTTQIAGMIARRIEYHDKANDVVVAGQRLGVIHLGSRVDLELPADSFEFDVKVGDYVRGSNTLIGRYIH